MLEQINRCVTDAAVAGGKHIVYDHLRDMSPQILIYTFPLPLTIRRLTKSRSHEVTNQSFIHQVKKIFWESVDAFDTRNVGFLKELCEQYNCFLHYHKATPAVNSTES